MAMLRRTDYFSAGLASHEIANKGGTDENSWAVTYGDITTLLLVFFILIASAAEVNTAKFERLKKMYKPEEITSVETLEKELKKHVEQNGLSDSISVEPQKKV